MPPIKRPTKLALARALIALVADWADGRTVYTVVDSAYAARLLLEDRPANVDDPQPSVTGRRALGAPRSLSPWPARPTTQAGPPPADPQGDGRHPPPLGPAAVHPLRPVRHPAGLRLHRPLVWRPARRRCRIVVVRDPSGRRRDEAFFCTDPSVDHACILEGYARRWTIEVAFYHQKQFLGFEDPQNQTPEAVARTAPLAGLVYDLVLLWYAVRVQQGHAADWTLPPLVSLQNAPRPSSTCSPPSVRNPGASTFLTRRRPHRSPQNSTRYLGIGSSTGRSIRAEVESRKKKKVVDVGVVVVLSGPERQVRELAGVVQMLVPPPAAGVDPRLTPSFRHSSIASRSQAASGPGSTTIPSSLYVSQSSQRIGSSTLVERAPRPPRARSSEDLPRRSTRRSRPRYSPPLLRMRSEPASAPSGSTPPEVQLHHDVGRSVCGDQRLQVARLMAGYVDPTNEGRHALSPTLVRRAERIGGLGRDPIPHMTVRSRPRLPAMPLS